MGRYTGPACKQCRREGMKLFLKGDRCYMAKCAVEQGRPVPGAQGGRRRPKVSDYGTQLREKQRLRRMYGVLESQFRLTFQRAAQSKGVTGEALLQLLELRLDNLVYRMGFTSSRRAARQFANHGNIAVNGKKATVASMTLKPGDVVEVRNLKNAREVAAPFMEAAESRGLAPWISLEKNQFRGELLRVPTRDEIAPIVNEQLIVELYSK